MLTPSLIGCVRCKGSSSFGSARVGAHLEQYVTRVQRAPVEQAVERGPQQPARIGHAACVVELLAPERQQRRTRKYQEPLRHSIDGFRTAFEAVPIAARRLEPRAARCFVLEIESPAELVEQALLEDPQRAGRTGLFGVQAGNQ